MTSFDRFLVERGTVPEAEMDRLRDLGRQQGESILTTLRRMGSLHEADLVAALAQHYDLEEVGPEDWPGGPVIRTALSRAFLRDNKILPIAEDGKRVVVAVADPSDEGSIDAVRVALGRPLVLRVASAQDIETAIDRVFEAAEQKIPAAEQVRGPRETEEDIQQLRDVALGSQVIQIVNDLFIEAVQNRATDIHVEPGRGTLHIRLRIDGMLRPTRTPVADLGRAIVSRIKILAGLDIAERRLPQDGRARIRVEGRQLDLRVATAPTINGESVVVRLLDNTQRALDFGKLGFNDRDRSIVLRHIGAPYGLILVTGPTGSGKTTTLATALTLLNEPHRKILSIEDPVEYQIDGINQTQVQPEIGVTFAHVLRSFLRHDPDVIMVGEMRDGETASIAMHAALTGHLVLSTLHTNTAAGAITRLQDMGLESFLLASSLHCVIGQRLVRVLCTNCREEYADVLDFPSDMLERAGVQPGASVRLWRPVGCNRCYGSGFAGRVGIFEVLDVDDRIKALIQPGISTNQIAQAAEEAGMHTMVVDGILKCLAGVTTPDEVRRVALSID